jgi:hypothetical protein
MNRIPRTAVAFVLSAALLAATAPAAHARTLAKPQPSAPIAAGGWFDAALAWVGGLGLGIPHTQGTRSMEKATSVPISSPTGPIVGAKPMTCSTIDPNGTAVCHGGGI